MRPPVDKEPKGVEEINGVDYLYRQHFFDDIRLSTGIDLENITFFKSDTYYLIMTAQLQSLLDKGVLKHSYDNSRDLLSSTNVNASALSAYAKEAALAATKNAFPFELIQTAKGEDDVSIFDFTSLTQSKNACRINQKQGHRLFLCLVGDSLIEVLYCFAFLFVP